MDAVPFVISAKGPKVRKLAEQYDMLRLLREFLQWRQGDSIILAEANVLPETDMDYFGKASDRIQFPGQPDAVLCAPPRSGAFSCAIMTSSILDA
jgi:hypothetical protein